MDIRYAGVPHHLSIEAISKPMLLIVEHHEHTYLMPHVDLAGEHGLKGVGSECGLRKCRKRHELFSECMLLPILHEKHVTLSYMIWHVSGFTYPLHDNPFPFAGA